MIFRPSSAIPDSWDDDDVAQGFSWQDGFVSFGIPDHDGMVSVKLFYNEPYENFIPQAERAIKVPFNVGDDGIIIGTVFDDFEENIDNCKYNIIFILTKNKDKENIYYDCLLFFVINEKQEFKIIKKDGEMNDSYVIKHYI